MDKIKNCSHKKLVIVDKNETYDVKGDSISIQAKVKKCAICGQEIFDMVLDTENLKQAYRRYKAKHNLLQSEEILALRKKFHLTQNMLSLLIGCTQATIARYERGSIQSETHNTALLLLQNPDNIKKIFEEKSGDFNPSERNILQQIFTDTDSVPIKSMELLENLYSYSPNVYSGFKRFDVEKFMAVVLFFALNQSLLYKTKLMKLLWYSDMLFFKENTISITGMKYIHQQYGPVPYQYSMCLSIMETLGIVELQEQEFGDIVLPKADKNLLDKLSKSEIEILKTVNEKFIYTKANEISSLSHKEKGYKETSLLDPISYEYAFALNV